VACRRKQEAALDRCGVACRRKQEAALDRIRSALAHVEATIARYQAHPSAWARERFRYWNPSATDWRESLRG